MILASNVRKMPPGRKKKKKRQTRSKPNAPLVWSSSSYGFRQSTTPVASPEEIEGAVSTHLPRVLSELVRDKAREFCGDLVSVATCRGPVTLLQLDDHTQRFLVVVQDEGRLYRFLVGDVAQPKELCEIHACKTSMPLLQVRLCGDFVVFLDGDGLEFVSLSAPVRTVKRLEFHPQKFAVMHSRFVILCSHDTCVVVDGETFEVDESFSENLWSRRKELDLALERLVLTMGDFLVTRDKTNSLTILRGRSCDHCTAGFRDPWCERECDYRLKQDFIKVDSDFLVGYKSFSFSDRVFLTVLRLSDQTLRTFEFDDEFRTCQRDHWGVVWYTACLLDDASALAVAVCGWYVIFDLVTGKQRAALQTNSIWAESILPWIDQTTVIVRTRSKKSSFAFYIWDTRAMSMTAVGERTPIWNHFQHLCVGSDGTVFGSAGSSLLVFQ